MGTIGERNWCNDIFHFGSIFIDVYKMKKDVVATKIGTALASVVIYLPIIAGIITPMMYLLPAWYASWAISAYIFPFYEFWHGFLITGVSEPVILFFDILWALVFLTGLSIFLWGLFEMTRNIRRKKDLVDTGPYSYVRHPQHLGILLMLLPFAFTIHVQAVHDIGTRPGDVLSWSLMAFLLLAVADFEESRLMKSLDGYAEYRSRVPFILPLKNPIDIDLPAALDSGKLGRYAVFFIIYWISMTLVLLQLTQLPIIFTR